MTNACECLAQLVADYDPSAMDDRLMNSVERAIVDTIAAILGGVETEGAERARAAAMAAFGGGDHVPWFTKGSPLSSLGALFANCVAASILDIDDGHRGASGHSSAAIIPAVLMEASVLGRSGREILAAIALGSDISLRIAAARVPTDDMSFASGRWTGYGVAAAVGKLRGLDASAIAHAMAIAGAEAPQNLPQGACSTSSVKGSNPWAAITSLVSVSRAQAGSNGSLDLLDRPDVYDVGRMLTGLGDRWLVDELYFKPYASCRYAHPAIDAVLEICDRLGDRNAIDRITVEIFFEASKIPNNVRPSCFEDAAFSIPFTVALAALRGGSALRPLRAESLIDPDVLDLAQRVELSYPAEFHNAFPRDLPARVTVFTRKEVLTSFVPIPIGDPRRPMTAASLRQKLDDLRPHGVSLQRLESLFGLVANLRYASARNLVEYLAIY